MKILYIGCVNFLFVAAFGMDMPEDNEPKITKEKIIIRNTCSATIQYNAELIFDTIDKMTKSGDCAPQKSLHLYCYKRGENYIPWTIVLMQRKKKIQFSSLRSPSGPISCTISRPGAHTIIEKDNKLKINSFGKMSQ